MKRLHIVGGKNHGKTTLIVELVKELNGRGQTVGTIKHTHHQHELDVPGKDSYRHRTAGAKTVGILSPTMTAIFMPGDNTSPTGEDRYSLLEPMFEQCRLVLVEGDSRATAPKIEVWRSELGTLPLAASDQSILAIVTDGEPPLATPIMHRSNLAALSDWILDKMIEAPSQHCA